MVANTEHVGMLLIHIHEVQTARLLKILSDLHADITSESLLNASTQTAMTEKCLNKLNFKKWNSLCGGTSNPAG